MIHFYFVQGKKESILATKKILSAFEAVSGIKININKNSVLCMNMDHNKAKMCANWMNCNKGSFPFTYLSLPLSEKRLPKQYWIPRLLIWGED